MSQGPPSPFQRAEPKVTLDRGPYQEETYEKNRARSFQGGKLAKSGTLGEAEGSPLGFISCDPGWGGSPLGSRVLLV